MLKQANHCFGEQLDRLRVGVHGKRSEKQIEAQLRAKLLPTGPVEVPLDEAEEGAALKQA